MDYKPRFRSKWGAALGPSYRWMWPWRPGARRRPPGRPSRAARPAASGWPQSVEPARPLGGGWIMGRKNLVGTWGFKQDTAVKSVKNHGMGCQLVGWGSSTDIFKNHFRWEDGSGSKAIGRWVAGSSRKELFFWHKTWNAQMDLAIEPFTNIYNSKASQFGFLIT